MLKQQQQQAEQGPQQPGPVDPQMSMQQEQTPGQQAKQEMSPEDMMEVIRNVRGN